MRGRSSINASRLRPLTFLLLHYESYRLGQCLKWKCSKAVVSLSLGFFDACVTQKESHHCFQHIGGFVHDITFQGPKGVLTRGPKNLLKNFIMKHAYGQCFLLKKIVSYRVNDQI